MTILGPLGPMWVAKVLAILGVMGVTAALVAWSKGQAFLPWLMHGLSMPVVALPHALIAPRQRATTAVVVVLALTNLVLVNYHHELFGRAWQYVMWESGVIESLTPINFLLGALVFTLAALAATGARRRWLFVYALADVVLAGEEVSWGQGQWLLDLDVPDFTNKYNPQTTLHHVLPGVGPIIIFFVIVALLRVCHPLTQRYLGLPMSVGFLNAVLLTLLVAPVMRFDHEHFLFFDEVYEWSGSVLLLHLALYEKWGWSFTT
jgi:hypothetical protein